MAATPQLRADARRNRERILAAAAERFAAEGIEVQMAEIARHAGVGNATVFRHFPTKRDLVVALVETQMGEMLAVAEEAAAAEDPVTGLRELVDSMCLRFVENHGLKQMTAAHFQGDERLIALRDRMLGLLGGLVERCQAAGAIRADVQPIDVVVLVNGVSAAMLGLEEERPGLHRRYLALALAGLSPAAADGPLPMEPPTPDELEAAWQKAPPGAGRC
jgi:AcrR family transcriptional regulator